MNYNFIKLFTLLSLLLSFSFAGEKRINRIVERFQEFEEYYTKPSAGCAHGWNMYRRHHAIPIKQVLKWESIPTNITTKVDSYLDSLLGNDWNKTLAFEILDISGRRQPRADKMNKRFDQVFYNIWFTYKTADTTYYTEIQTDSIASYIILGDVALVTSEPKKIRSITKLWKEKVEAGELSKWARPSEIFLKYNRPTKSICWQVVYYLGPIRFIGASYLIKIDPYSGEILSKRKI